MDSRARTVSVKTCFDGKKNGPVTGVMFTVAVEGDDNIDLPMIGNEGRTCKTLTLSAPITHIEVSTDNGLVNAIRWVVNPNQKTYGDYDSTSGTEWTFTEETPVIGLYGQVNENNEITQLGFVTASPSCEELIEAEATAPEPMELTFNSEGNMMEEDMDDEEGSMGVVIIILVIAIIVVVAIIAAVLYLKGRGNKGTTPVNTSVKASPPPVNLNATPIGTDAGVHQSMDADLIGTAKGAGEEKVNTDAFATAGTDGAYKK